MRIKCHDCDEWFSVAADHRGKFRCQECLSTVDRDDDTDARRPSHRRRDAEDDDDLEDGGRNNKGLLIAAIAVGSVLALAVVAVGLFFALRPTKKGVPQPDVAIFPGGGAGGGQNVGVPPPVSFEIPKTRPGMPPPPTFTSPTPSATENEIAARTPWAMPVDPPSETLKLPANPKNLTLPVPTNKFGNWLYLPSTPSPFFALGDTQVVLDSMTLWDLRTQTSAGTIRGKTELRQPHALSPDGKYFAGVVGFKKVVDVYDFATGAGVRRLEFKGGAIEWLDFGPGSKEIIAYHTDFITPTLQFWNIASGTMTRSMPLPKLGLRTSLTLSPGRNHFVISGRQHLWAYRLSDLKLVGALLIPQTKEIAGNMTYMECEGLAFSHDGTELAALFTRNGSRIVAWGIADGRRIVDHEITGEVRSAIPHNLIEYTPDGRAWIVGSNDLIERETGMTLTKIQPLDRTTSVSPARLLPNDQILMVVDNRVSSSRSVQTIPFDRAAFDVAAKAARAAMAPPTPTVAADRSAIRTIAAVASTAWAVTADGVTVKNKQGADTPLFKHNSFQVQEAMLGKAAPRAATVSVADVATPYKHKSLIWDRYDTTAGKHLGSVELATVRKASNHYSAVVAALSPKGTRLAMCSANDKKRVDLWSDDGMALAGFLPADGPVEWMAFVNEDRLLTLAEGHLTLWEVPACRAVYQTAKTYRGTPGLSMNNAWVAVHDGTGFDFLDTATGECRGRIAAGEDVKDSYFAASAAFTPDGTRFAGVAKAATGYTVITADVATGKIEDSFHALNLHSGPLQWCGPRHILQGELLIDLDLKCPVWRYGNSTRFVSGSTDGRYWFIREGNRPWEKTLASTMLPDAAAGQLLASLRQPTARMILGPGAAVSVQLNAAGPNGDAEFAKTHLPAIQRSLERQGFIVREGAPVTLTINVSEAATGKTYEFRKFGGGGPDRRQFQLRTMTVDMSLTTTAGATIWTEKQSFAQSGAEGRIFEGNQDPEKVLVGEAWNLCTGYMTSPRVPPRAFTVNDAVVILPGFSSLGL